MEATEEGVAKKEIMMIAPEVEEEEETIEIEAAEIQVEVEEFAVTSKIQAPVSLEIDVSLNMWEVVEVVEVVVNHTVEATMVEAKEVAEVVEEAVEEVDFLPILRSHL